MTFRGVKLIKPVRVDRGTTSELYFDNLLDHSVRERWLNAGYPVYYDHISNKSFIIIDSSTRLEDTRLVDVKCDFGCSSVGSIRHHWQCSARTD